MEIETIQRLFYQNRYRYVLMYYTIFYSIIFKFFLLRFSICIPE